MRTDRYSDFAGSSLEGRHDPALLKRLGRELAVVYHAALDDTLPPRLQALAERIRGSGSEADQNRAHRPGLPRG
jgi:hypothetical protein